jgi:nitroreductase
MDVIKAILARHSVRDFSSKPVAKEKVLKILEIATRSPSGGNGQPWEVLLVGQRWKKFVKRIRNVHKVLQEVLVDLVAPVDRLLNLILSRSV